MARWKRIHLSYGTYYVVQRGPQQRPIFVDKKDYEELENLLAGVLAQCSARLWAYCWIPDRIHMAIQIGETPLASIMRSVLGRYARYRNRSTGNRGHFFSHRYSATLVDPRIYLGRLIRTIHQIPVRQGLVRRAEDYPYSSFRAYARGGGKPWLSVHRSEDSVKPSDALKDGDADLFERGGLYRPGVLGDADFIAALPKHSSQPNRRISLDRIVKAVAWSLGLEEQDVLSHSRQRDLVLARALVTWFALELRVATLSGVARYLRRDPSTLYAAVTHYKVLQPERFKLESFKEVVPLAITMRD